MTHQTKNNCGHLGETAAVTRADIVGCTGPTGSPGGRRPKPWDQWTSEPPRVRGWYWWRHPVASETARVIWLDRLPQDDEIMASASFGAVRVSKLNGEWCGPLIAPK